MNAKKHAWLLGATLALAALLVAAPAEAGHRHPRHHPRPQQHGIHDHRHFSHGERHGPRHRGQFVVPRSLDRRHVRVYRPYYGGLVYHGGHRHHHAVYRFPVYTELGWVERPHYYCGGALYGGGRIAYRGRHVRFSIDF